jgi:glycine betaine/proline transport system ATP-binding protein
MTDKFNKKTVIECKSVYKIFGENAKKLLKSTQGPIDAKNFQAAGCIVGVNDASFKVYEGEILVVMGLSGSGKSTLLRCISRLSDITSGQVLIEDQDINTLNEKELIALRRSKMGMVFQSFALLPHKTVLENIAFPLQIKGMPLMQSIERAKEMIELVILTGRENYFPRQLSGGQQQRVGIARSLAVEPDIWFLDEPFSALDPLIRTEMQDEFLRLQKILNKTIVFVTHDFEEALRLADRIAIMKDGIIEQIARPSEIILNPATAYVAKFTNNVPREKVLRCKDIMDPLPADAQKLASDVIIVSSESILEEIAARVLKSDQPATVVDHNRTPVGQIHRDKIINIVFSKHNLEAKAIQTL